MSSADTEKGVDDIQADVFDDDEEALAPLVRSGSFTKEKPSGVVPECDIPNVGSVNIHGGGGGESAVQKLARSGSFTKITPGIAENLIPKIEVRKIVEA